MPWWNKPTDWEVQALVIISAQLKDIQHKLDVLLAAEPKVSATQLAELQAESGKLKAKSDLLAQAIENQQKKG